jgi:sigma-B regulation protein RsbU (phosphoserine phosphatase)
MLTASLAGLYRALSAREEQKASGEFLPDLHRQLLELAEGKYTMTLSAILVDEEKGAIKWWNAGGPPVFIMNPDGKVDVISEPGIPLGSAHGFQLGEVSRPLLPGARIFAFTDGMYEVDRKNGRQVGLKGLLALFSKTRGLSLDDAVKCITGEIEEVRAPGPLPDDMTFTMLDFRGSS